MNYINEHTDKYYFGLKKNDVESIAKLLKEKVNEGYTGIETWRSINELPANELKEQYNIAVVTKREYTCTKYDVDWGEYNRYITVTYIKYVNC